MISRRFTTGLALRLIILGGALAATIWIVLRGGHIVGASISFVILLVITVELWLYVSRTNREIARFLGAIRYADFSRRFSFAGFGAGYDGLGDEMTAIIDNLREQDIGQEIEVRKLRALIEHIPVPLLTLHADDSITLRNNAARRLFGAAHVARLQDLRQFDASFAEGVATAVPGVQELVRFSVGDVDYQLTLAATEIIVGGDSERLISLQDIQSELDATQAEAWQDLVKVLTHEIINSISPVTSLAASASELVDDVVRKAQQGELLDEELEDLQAAVSIVSRRSHSLTQFVDSFRQISRLAPPEKKRIRLRSLFDDVTRLAKAEWPESHQVMIEDDVTPAELDVYADRDLLEPVLLNLVRNAWQATLDVVDPHLRLMAKLNTRGNVIIEVSDNGPGVNEKIARKIFVPFFTTKEGGSGVGLALARQVMIAHGGFIRMADNKGGGATFRLTF